MSFDIPNLGDTSFPEQARPYSSDFAILGGAAGLVGVKSGCAVTAQASPNMTVAVASGTIYAGSTAEVAVTSGNVTITTANGSNPRVDLVVASATGVKSAVAGTPAGIPVAPAVPAGSIALAQVVIPAGDTTIGATQIKDRRMSIVIPTVVGATSIVRKTANEGVTSSVTLQDDNHLVFTATPNNQYQMKIALIVFPSPVRINWTAPASSTWRWEWFQFTTTLFQSYDVGTDILSGTPASGFGQGQVMVGEGILVTAGTGGPFQLRWAQQTSSGTASQLLANSYLEYRALP